MSQRIRRAQDRKNQIDGSTMSTGGHVVRYDRGEAPVVRVPQKATGDVPGDKLTGLAKASPFFQKLAEVLPPTKAEEQKAIAEASEEVVDDPEAEAVKETQEEDEQEAD